MDAFLIRDCVPFAVDWGTVLAAADFFEDSEFLFPCSAAARDPVDLIDEILAFALPGLSVSPSSEIVLSRAVRLLFHNLFCGCPCMHAR
jgi:hypothetical protein